MNPDLQTQGAGPVTAEGSPFLDLLSKEFKVKPDSPKNAAVQMAVKTLAEQALTETALISDNVVETIKTIIAEIDKKLSEQINKIIHHEDFKTLEASWRGLHHLVYNTETDEMLQIKVLNISKKELDKTFKKYPDAAWDQSPLFKKIYEEEYGVFGGQPFGSFVGDYYFDHSPGDVGILSGMAQISAASHAPFITAPAPSLMGMESWEELNNPRDLTKIFQQKEYLPWKALRDSDDAKYLGLAMPRFLARLPYGAKTVPVEGFDFEEDSEGADHSKYVWSNAAYAMGANITKAFKLYGWCTQIRGRQSGGLVENLPCHTFKTSDGSSDLKCPTEVAIPDRREAELAANGLIPLCYIKNSNEAVFVGAQSVYKAKKWEGKDGEYATSNENLSARLPYMFATSRFAHYLKCMVRDMVGRNLERAELQTYLQNWINNYVLPNPESSGEEMKARKPLKDAGVEVKEVEGNPGFYSAVFKLQPHHQLEGVAISLRLVSKLKKAG